MATYLQADRPMIVSCSELERDDLLLVGFTCNEQISQLFSIDLELLAENQREIQFEKILGGSVTISLALGDGNRRYFNGICKKVSQGWRDPTFTSYRMEVVPKFWLLTKIHRSRIFQQKTIPEILVEVLAGIEIRMEVPGAFHPRDYCVQYQETDFAFASRLMEEEGIFYFFEHAEGLHTMVLGNTPQSHRDMPEFSEILWEDIAGGVMPDFRIHAWEKSQELRSGKYTLWDNIFEMPDKHLEAEQPIDEEIQAGKVKHKLKLEATGQLEIYEYPGEYAQRFDGVAPGGDDRSSDLRKIFQDNKRTVAIRMQQETVPALTINGAGVCRNFTSGHKFTLRNHFNADGEYLLTGVEHIGRMGSGYRSGETEEMTYENRFTCIPFAVPFRPRRLLPRPRIHGTQTAIVVGPEGEEIFTDKYGRIKVQFPWDREGNYNESSSCWIRVTYPIAGVKWGSICLPRIGQEVVVSFEDGDPDRPIVVGSVYNYSTMPPYSLPDNKTKTVFLKSDSSPHKPGFNEIRFEDKNGEEDFFTHAEKDMDIRVKNDRRELIGRDRHLKVARDKVEEIGGDLHVTTKRHRKEKVRGENHLLIGGNSVVSIIGGQSVKIQRNAALEVFGNQSCAIHGTSSRSSLGSHLIGSDTDLTLVGPSGFIKIDSAGVWIKGDRIFINSGGGYEYPENYFGLDPASPAAPQIPLNADPGDKSPTYRNQVAAMTPAQQAAANAPRHDPNAEENRNKRSWIEIELVDDEGRPVPGEEYQVTLPDGTTIDAGTLDMNGRARVDHIDPGTCRVTFPHMDRDVWEPA